MSKWIGTLGACVGTIVLAAGMFAIAGEPTTKPSSTAGDHAKSGGKSSARAGWGYAPYNQLSGITDEQRLKISDIHRKFIAEKRALEDKQDDDVMALLTDEQKIELDKMKADEKAKNAEHRKSGKDSDKDADDKK